MLINNKIRFFFHIFALVPKLFCFILAKVALKVYFWSNIMQRIFFWKALKKTSILAIPFKVHLKNSVKQGCHNTTMCVQHVLESVILQSMNPIYNTPLMVNTDAWKPLHLVVCKPWTRSWRALDTNKDMFLSRARSCIYGTHSPLTIIILLSSYTPLTTILKSGWLKRNGEYPEVAKTFKYLVFHYWKIVILNLL